jgi:DNA-binding NtrC family response regulator
MRDGAFDFVDAREPLSRWEEAFRKASTSQQLWLQLYGDRRSSGDTRLVGKSAAMQSVVRTIERIGPTPANVLIIGESGTGKEKAAQALHETSGLTGPFLPVNCAAIPRDLIESELFGSEKGAFTGALQPRQGLVEQAAGGTLFLDEIGELDIALQPKLLRFLESRRARRVGGRTEYNVDARILAATNRDLEARIESNEFRADLYYRLSEIVIKIPPLRAHIEDLPLLAQHFLDQANEKFGKNFVSTEPVLLAAMMKHTWPGNARELRAAVHRMAVLHHGPILRAEWWESPAPPSAPLPSPVRKEPPVATPHSPAPASMNRRQKWDRARDLLRESGNDQSWTAAQLGIHPTTLFRWVKAGKV